MQIIEAFGLVRLGQWCCTGNAILAVWGGHVLDELAIFFKTCTSKSG